jgi:heptosyltransferase-2
MREMRYKFDRLLELTLIPFLKILFDLYFLIKRKRFPRKIDRVLIVALNRGIGDAVLYSPSLNVLRKTYPGANISIVVNTYVKELVDRFRTIDNILVYNSKRMKLREKIDFIKQLRMENYDLAFDFIWNRFTESAVLTFFSGTKYTVGFDHDLRSLFFNHRFKADFDNTHVADLIFDLVNSCAIREDNTVNFDRLETNDEEESFCAQIFEKYGISNRDIIIGIQPGARDGLEVLEKRWTVEGYAQVSDHLIERHNAKILFLGDFRETRRGDEINFIMRYSPVNLIGRTSIGELISVLKRCNLLICNNSGLLHIAVALNIPTISFGGVNLNRWGPYYKNHKHKVLSPVISSKTPLIRNKDLKNVSLRTVIRSVEEVL